MPAVATSKPLVKFQQWDMASGFFVAPITSGKRVDGRDRRERIAQHEGMIGRLEQSRQFLDSQLAEVELDRAFLLELTAEFTADIADLKQQIESLKATDGRMPGLKNTKRVNKPAKREVRQQPEQQRAKRRAATKKGG